jgi:hypothetical protein
MSVVHNLQIAPKESRVIPLKAIRKFISTLIDGGHIEKEYSIWTGESEIIKEIDHYYFNDWSVLSEAKVSVRLDRVRELNLSNTSEFKNYVFKIHISKESELFRNLAVFEETNFQHFPVFILFFHQPIDYKIIRDFWADEGHINEEVLVHTINCVIVASGRNSESVYGLDNEKDYPGFYDYVRGMFGEYEIGVYYT